MHQSRHTTYSCFSPRRLTWVTRGVILTKCVPRLSVTHWLTHVEVVFNTSIKSRVCFVAPLSAVKRKTACKMHKQTHVLGMLTHFFQYMQNHHFNCFQTSFIIDNYHLWGAVARYLPYVIGMLRNSCFYFDWNFSDMYILSLCEIKETLKKLKW